jgi:hypothetical protein
MTQRKLWLHSWTDKALLVSPSFISHNGGEWLPRSQIVVEQRQIVKRGPLILGTLLTLQVPAWLCDKRRLTADAEIPAGTELENSTWDKDR